MSKIKPTLSVLLVSLSIALFAFIAPVAHPIVDSALSPAQAVRNKNFPHSIVDSQEVVTVRYHGFDKRLHEGQLVVHRELAQDIRYIFKEIEADQFPIKKVVPIVKYGWDDDRSIADNNSSGFNYRVIAGTSKLSDHAYGRAVDLNPYLNPWVGRRGVSTRPYDTTVAGTFTKSCVVVRAFEKRGWVWGGSWKNSKDYQHFSKSWRQAVD